MSATPEEKKHGLHIVGHSEKNTVRILSASPEKHGLHIVGQSGKRRSAYSSRPIRKKHGLHIHVGQSGKNTVCIFMSANPEKHGLIIVGQTWKNTVCILSSNPEKKHGLHIVFQSGKTRSAYCLPIRKNTVFILSSNPEKHVLHIVGQSGEGGTHVVCGDCPCRSSRLVQTDGLGSQTAGKPT